ncbi:MAG: transcription antitermination factor NusB [Nitrospirae bacterium]|nr:transcription antitermination factor NusB [Nitrospirota bacterium]
MKRRKGREFAFQFLFQFDFTGRRPAQKDFDEFWADKDVDLDGRAFTEDLVLGTIDNLREIDASIQKAAENWVLQRMAAVDRNVLRAATYELLYRKDIPSAVTINEAIEIAKRYSSVEAASFINGILDTIARGIEGKGMR